MCVSVSTVFLMVIEFLQQWSVVDMAWIALSTPSNAPLLICSMTHKTGETDPNTRDFYSTVT